MVLTSVFVYDNCLYAMMVYVWKYRKEWFSLSASEISTKEIYFHAYEIIIFIFKTNYSQIFPEK